MNKPFQILGPFLCDAYKTEHHRMYPEGITRLVSNLTPRNSKYSKVPVGLEGYNGSVVYGGVKDAWELEIAPAWSAWFDLPRADAIQEVELFLASIGSNHSAETLAKWGDLHDLQHLPLAVYALPVGTVVATNTPVLQITNTDPRFAWLVNYMETALSAALWKVSTSATTAAWYRALFDSFAQLTGADPTFPNWQGHDFSYRGMSNSLDTVLSGLGHLYSFLGSDSLPAIAYAARAYENATFVGASVPATEHSVMCAGGKETEIETFRRLIKLYPTGVVSIVSDTWDYWDVLTKFLPELKDEILARIPNEMGLAKVVIRPDSGDPETILCGEAYEVSSLEVDPYLLKVIKEKLDACNPEILVCHKAEYYYVAPVFNEPGEWNFVKVDQVTPAMKGSLRILEEAFGSTKNDKGFKQLNPRIGLIYGDSITPERASSILRRMHQMGYASDNVVFGIGSYTYQGVTRDTHSFAMKATFAEINDQPCCLQKLPATDVGKKSRTGILAVIENQDGVPTVKEGIMSMQEFLETPGNLLTPVSLTCLPGSASPQNQGSLTDIRSRIAEQSVRMFDFK